jgi:hypothetical protein
MPHSLGWPKDGLDVVVDSLEATVSFLLQIAIQFVRVVEVRIALPFDVVTL